MGLRVIAGQARGHRLQVPRGQRTRPTSELVRGALFNMLEHRGWLTDALVVDLFAGSGALGIEALSRGARAAVFVESDPRAVRALRANLTRSRLTERAEVLTSTVPLALRALARRGTVVDGVLADPPYGAGWVARTLAALSEGSLLRPGGWIALEHRTDETPPPVPGLAVVQSRRHGRTALTLLVREASA
jgi:16S rRNA (guanine(966)-N(2))-methyltransferase RsmD